MDKLQLVNLCSRTWTLKALALMAEGHPARISPLAAKTGCGRSAMGASIEHLMKFGLLELNPGQGHPLRPEFKLTAMGRPVAEWALALYRLLPDPQDNCLLCRKWTLLVIGSLDREQRYSVLKKRLTPVTDRALSQCLIRLINRRWVARRIFTDRIPPNVSYRTCGTGLIIHHHVLDFPKV